MISPIRLRQWHGYIGLFIAPSVLFFAMTGAIQLFSLHESHGSYRPAVLVEMFSAVHKDQVFEQPHEHEAPAQTPAPAAGPDDADVVRPATLALKWFFLAVALALIVSTCIGVWLGITRSGRKMTSVSLLLAGVLIPLGLLVI